MRFLVFFIDIDMPEVNGFEVASYLKKWNRECCIVFVSNKDDLVFQSLVYHPFFFIRKAHLDEELEPQLLELQKKAGKKVPQIELQTGRQSVKLALRDIWFVESEKNYLLFYREKDTRDEAIRVRMKMSEAEKKLEAHKFVRTHKGYLVNMNYVYRLREKELLLLNGKSIPVSRNYLNQVRMKISGSGDGMSATFWKVFELAISVWENILLLEFCMDFMQQKPKGKKGKILWGIAVLFGLIFPALEKYPALYDRWEMWITLIWLFVYLMVGTQGSVLRKVTAAVVARAVLMMVNTAILFGGSFILQESVASFNSRSGYSKNCDHAIIKNFLFFCW